MAFLGGVNRRIGKTGEIGFHQYRTHSIQPNINVSEEQSKDVDIMLSQGVSDSFVKKVFSATPDEMWLPGHAELLSAGVITEHPR